MRAYATVRSPDGRLHELIHGDIIGRLGSAALSLDDGRVSEAHAMVSLREGELRLIALRGAFAVEGRPTGEATLCAGLEVQLARGLSLRVEEVVLPDWILGVEGGGLPRQALPSVCSIRTDPELRVVRGWAEGAAAWVWSTGDGWRARPSGGEAAPIAVGDSLPVAGHALRLVAIPLSAAGQAITRQGGGVDAPLRIVACFDTVHLHREREPVITLSGLMARVLSELVALGGPVSWSVLAGQLWPGEPDHGAVRARLDVLLSRLRRKLREGRVRADLVRMDGAGQVELLLYPHDVVEDRT